MSAPGRPAEGPSLDLFFRTVNAFHATAALRSAIELDLFTAIGEGNTLPESIAARAHASAKGIRVLCDYLTVLGFLTKNGRAYSLSADAAFFLDKQSPAYAGTIIQFLLTPEMFEAFHGLTGAVRKGGTMLGVAPMEPDHPIWRQFARAMVPLMAMPAEMIATILGSQSGQRWKVLDVAAGHGLFGINIARINPNAEVTAVDWESVLEIAREHAQAAGVASRFHTIPGSAFDVDFGSGYDVVLLTNFLHHFDAATCEVLLRKVYAALKPGGRAATLEFVPNPDRVSPPAPATFALIMLATTASGDAYTYAELEEMFATAGFARSEMHELPPTAERLVVSYK
jgi:ubiquinone/menaquinone biosynthesis C-methylase UbiE